MTDYRPALISATDLVKKLSCLPHTRNSRQVVDVNRLRCQNSARLRSTDVLRNSGVATKVRQAFLEGYRHGLRPGCDLELGKDTLDVESNRPFTYAKNPADFQIGFAACHPYENGQFSRRKILSRTMSRRSDWRRHSPQGPQHEMAQVLGQGEYRCCIKSPIRGECAKRDESICLIGRPYGYPVMEAKASCCGDEAPILLGRQTVRDRSPMIRTWGSQRGLEYGVTLR